MTALNSTVIPAGLTCGLRTRTRHALAGANSLEQRVGDRGRERLEQVEPARVAQLADPPPPPSCSRSRSRAGRRRRARRPRAPRRRGTAARGAAPPPTRRGSRTPAARAARGSPAHRLRRGQRLDVLAHVVHAEDRRAAIVGGDRGADGDRGRADLRAAAQDARERCSCARSRSSTGRPIATSSSSRRTSSKLCAAVLPKPIPGSRHTFSLVDPRVDDREREPLLEEPLHVRDDVVIAADPPASSAARPACA